MPRKTIFILLLFLNSHLFPLFAQNIHIEYVDKFANINHPQILYWMWNEETLAEKQYLKDIERMAENSSFDLVILSSRFKDGVGFWNTQRMKPHLKEAVEYANKKGIKIGLQLWPMNRSQELYIEDYPIDTKDAEALITEGEAIIDDKGFATVVNKPLAARANRCISSGVLKVWLFKKTSDGFYDSSTLIEANADWVTSKKVTSDSLQISLHTPAKYAGYTAYVLTRHYYNYFDVFSLKHSEIFKKMMDAYSDIPFNAMALDENGNMSINNRYFNRSKTSMSDRTWSDDFEVYYQRVYQSDPIQLLLEMRYAPQDRPKVRIQAVNRFFEARLKGATMIENIFYDYVKKTFGNDCFIGCHSTYHNTLTGADVWTTGVNWWDLPREYGQSDETHPMPDRMGIALSGCKSVMYNMFYHKEKDKIYKEAINSAAYGCRTHYHAWNDRQGWGQDIGDAEFLKGLEPIEDRISLLNHFNPVAPRLSVLVIYNFPYVFNWYPDEDMKNPMGVRNIDLQKTALSIWESGYTCASIPSTWIEKNMLTVNDDGKVRIKDRIFDAVVFLEPQYAKHATLDFLEKLLDRNGKLMLKGIADKDFDGNCCKKQFERIQSRSLVFDIDNLPLSGIMKNDIPNGIRLQDGSVIMSNYESITNNENTPFSININGNEYGGSYQGTFALKIDDNGNIEKLVCGNFKSLRKDGKTIFELKNPSDVFLIQTGESYSLTIKWKSNKVLINNLNSK